MGREQDAARAAVTGTTGTVLAIERRGHTIVNSLERMLSVLVFSVVSQYAGRVTSSSVPCVNAQRQR